MHTNYNNTGIRNPSSTKEHRIQTKKISAAIKCLSIHPACDINRHAHQHVCILEEHQV